MSSQRRFRVSMFWVLFVAALVFVGAMTAPIWLVLYTHDLKFSNTVGPTIQVWTAHIYVVIAAIWFAMDWWRRRRARRSLPEAVPPQGS